MRAPISAVLLALLCTLMPLSLAQAADALRFESPWLRATPPGAAVGAGYATLRNDGDVPRVIVGVETAIAAEAMIHSMTHQNGMMKMRHLDQLEIPAHGSAVLKPGADHLMLMDLKQPLAKGQTVPLDFVFADGTRQRVDFAVRDTAP